MASTLTEFIIKCGSIYYDGNPTKNNKAKFNSIGCHYGTLEGFKNASVQDFNNLSTIEGKKCFSPLTFKEQQALTQLQEDCGEIELSNYIFPTVSYIIYEMVVEGGITRYLALFKDVNVERIGTIRSSRHYYLDYALENDAIYVHWGWSEFAQRDISTLGINNINAIDDNFVYIDNITEDHFRRQILNEF